MLDKPPNVGLGSKRVPAIDNKLRKRNKLIHKMQLPLIVLCAFLCVSLSSAETVEGLKEKIANIYCTTAQACLKKPLRKIDGKIVNITPHCAQLQKIQRGEKYDASQILPGWELFFCKVLQVLDDGLLVTKFEFPNIDSNGETVFVRNLPSEDSVVDGERRYFFAKNVGRYSYKTTAGARATVPSYDYGLVPTKEEIVEAANKQSLSNKDAAEKVRVDNVLKKSEAENKALKWNQDQAEKGDPYGQYRMGMRYLNGDGVAKDETKAREWFIKASAQNHVDAKAELKKLSQ